MAERIQDFILDQSIEEINQSATPRKKAAPPKCEYEVIFASGPDFAVRRKTTRTSTVMVVILSKGQTYIKDESNGGVVETLTQDNLQKFLKDAPDNGIDITTQDGGKPNWISTLNRDASWREAFLEVVRSDIKRELIKNDMFVFDGSIQAVPCYIKGNCSFKDVKAVFNEVASHYGREAAKQSFCTNRGEVNMMMDALFGYNVYMRQGAAGSAFSLIEERWGIEGVKQFVAMFCETPITRFPNYNVFESIFFRHENRYAGVRGEETVFDLGSMVDYMFCECTRQGFADDPGGFWSLWSDYLNHQYKLRHEIQDKYSENLATDEKIASYKVRLLSMKIDKEKFAEAAARMANYEYVGQKYRIIAPKTNEDLVEEGRQMSHCVGRYGDSVASGRCMIFFMRSNAAPTKSCVTIEVRSDGSLGQVRERFNRKPTSEHMAFVEKWHAKFFQNGIAFAS